MHVCTCKEYEYTLSTEIRPIPVDVYCIHAHRVAEQRIKLMYNIELYFANRRLKTCFQLMMLIIIN